MKKINHHFHKQRKNIGKHLSAHKHKYLFGTFGTFAIVKMILLFAGFLGITNRTGTFAQTPEVELNSGNITQAPFNCSTGATSCALSNKGITSIAPDTFVNHTNLQQLNLGGNQINSIEAGDFDGLTNLQQLYLYSNQISSIEAGDFDGLTNLNYLGLHYNQISSIEAGVFDGLSNLQQLNLGRNQISSIEAGDFDGLTNLTTLYLDYNQISSIEAGVFDGLTNLYYLELNYNKLSSIESGAFAGLTNLQQLGLENNQISSIDSGTFAGLSNLNYLGLENNQISSIEAGDFDGLTNLQQLYLGGNQISSIDSGDFDGLTNLKQLNLYSNQISSIEAGVFAGLTNLNHLGLGGNQISSIEAGDFDGLTNLQRLYLYSNQISSIEAGVFDGLTNLQYLGLDSNQISSIEAGDFDGLTNLQRLYLNSSCNTNGNEDIQYSRSTTSTDNANCVVISSATDTGNFIIELENRGYSLDSDYYVGNLALSFNHPNAGNQIIVPIIMKSVNQNRYFGNYYNSIVEVQYDLGTSIMYDGQPFTGILHGPVLFSTKNIYGLSGVLALMRFGALTHRIDFTGGLVTLRMPAIGKNIGDILSIYSSDAESIYNSDPERIFEKTGTVVGSVVSLGTCSNGKDTAEDKCNANGGTWLPGEETPYVEFTTNHASRYALTNVSDTIPPENTGEVISPENTGNVTPPAPITTVGGSIITKDICENMDCTDSYYDKACGVCPSKPNKDKVHQAPSKMGDITNSPYSTELNVAYLRAYNFGITTMPTIQQANIEGNLIRSHMAKMMSNFAIKTLQTPINTGRNCTFADMNNQSKEMKEYAQLACQLGLMGLQSDGTTPMDQFMPNEVVTRAQFGTVISRMLRGDKNEGGNTYYAKHLQALNQSGIMKKIDTPLAQELRGRTMLMLMRVFEEQK